MQPGWLYRLRATHIIFIAAFAIALMASTYRLTEAPGIWYDEGYYTQMAMNLAERGQEVLQIAPNTFISSATQTAGFPLVAPVALSYRLFGVGVLQGRAVMAVFILLLVAAAALLLRSQRGELTAAWGSLLLAAFPLVHGNGKSVLGEIPGLFFLLLTLYALQRLENESFKPLRWYIAAGLAAGLCIATKPIFILLAPAILAVFLIRVRKIPLSWVGFGAAIAACAIPILIWIRLQFGAGDTITHILSFYINPYDTPDIARSAIDNAKLFITSATPAFTLVATIAWLAAIVRRVRNSIYIPSAELIGFSFVICILLAFLRMPGWYRYIFPGTILSLIYLPRSLDELGAIEWIKNKNVRTLVVQGLLIAFFALELIQLGSTSYVASYYASHRTRDVSAALRALPVSASLLFYNVPELVILAPSQNYYQYLQPHAVYDAEGYGREQLVHIADKSVDYIIVMSAVYRSNPDAFQGYRVMSEANRYSILVRL